MESTSLLSTGLAQASDGRLVFQSLYNPSVVERSPSPQTAKIRQAAQEFESILLHSWWQSMTESFGSPFDLEGDSAAESLGDWGLQAMSSAIAASGGIGIARMLLEKLHLEPAHQNSPTTGTKPLPDGTEDGTSRSPLQHIR